jgi:hypothetical protein
MTEELKTIRNAINEATAGMSDEDLAEFMNELCEWAAEQAAVAEYELTDEDY